MDKQIYRIKDFCENYSISRRSFYREVNANRLHIFKRGGRTYIARDDAEAWMQAQRFSQQNN